MNGHRACLTQLSNYPTLKGSFSAVSKRNFASKYALESSRRDLHNALLCTGLQSNFLELICSLLFSYLQKVDLLRQKVDLFAKKSTYSPKSRLIPKSPLIYFRPKQASKQSASKQASKQQASSKASSNQTASTQQARIKHAPIKQQAAAAAASK